MGRTAIINALIFDGQTLHRDFTVIIEDENIISFSSSPDTSGASIVDGKGATLLPGFIDAHVHLENSPETSPLLLKKLVQAGVTTALDMGLLYGPVRESFHKHSCVADVRFAGNFATSTGSTHSRFKHAIKESIVDSSETAVQFVQDRVTEGADYIKIVADIPGPSQEIVNKLASEARRHGKLSVAHAARKASFAMAQEGKVDVITHAPLDKPLNGDEATLMKDEGRVSVPTLIMEKAIAAAGIFPGLDYSAARESVAQLHRAGVPILAGTDANSSPMAPVKHGAGFHQELELLVEAGVSNEEALRAGTSLAAKHFRLEDRGVIAGGRRADLVLVEGNPIEDITTTKGVIRVWIAGEEVVLND